MLNFLVKLANFLDKNGHYDLAIQIDKTIFAVDESKRKFTTGYCAEYAQALHELTGYPIFIIKGYGSSEDDFEPYEIAHVFVSPDGGNTAIDAIGTRSVQGLVMDSFFTNKPVRITVDPISASELETEMPSEPEALREARVAVASEGIEPSRPKNAGF